MLTIISIKEKTIFGLYIDDHLSLIKTFEDMYQFLHETYFLHIAFGLVYLIGKKMFPFNDKLDMLGFEGIVEGLRPAF